MFGSGKGKLLEERTRVSSGRENATRSKVDQVKRDRDTREGEWVGFERSSREERRGRELGKMVEVSKRARLPVVSKAPAFRGLEDSHLRHASGWRIQHRPPGVEGFYSLVL